MTACTSPDARPEAVVERAQGVRPEVIFAITDNGSVARELEVRGTFEARRDIQILSRLGGRLRLSRLHEGARVERGDTLFALEDAEWRLRLEETTHAYRLAEEAYRIESAQRRQAGGSTEGYDDTLLRQQTGYASARVARDRAALELGYAAVVAPFAGVLHLPQPLTEGAWVSPGAELGRLMETGTVRVRLDVLETDLADLRIGLRVVLRGPAGSTYEGRISAIAPRVDPERKSGQVLVDVPNPEGNLKPGMSVTANIRLAEYEGRIRAPREALLERDGRRLVFRLRGDQVEWIYVEPVIVTSEYVLLAEETFAPGDTLAVDRHFAISHQQQVDARLR